MGNRPTRPSTGHRAAVVTLVHGTFARDAPWTRPGSALSAALRQVDCHVTQFTWSGRNSHRARSRGALALAEHLQQQVTEHPGATQWMIAHSHGGNVALHAADRLRIARGGRTRATTVTLATPFLHARARTVTGWPLFIIALFSAFVVVATLGAAVAGPRSRVDTVTVVGGVAFTALLVLCIAGGVMHWRSLGRGWRGELVAAIHTPSTRPEETIVIRASGDEASGLLVAGQFVGWLSAVATRLLSNLWLWAAVIGLTQFAVITADVAGRGGRLAISVLLYGFTGAGLAALAAAVAMVGSAVVFGMDGPFVGLVASCSAEAAPPGSATLLQLEPRTAVTRSGLAHSSLYDDDQVINYIVSAVQASSR